MTSSLADLRSDHINGSLPKLFKPDIEDRVLLSCHLLGKPTAEQLFRLHSDQVSGARAMRSIVGRLSRSPEGFLSVIKPIDITNTSRSLPYLYLDTTKSRRHLEKTCAVPFRRPPELPSRDWRFLRHDVTLVDELVSFELSARARSVRFGYESHFDLTGDPVYPPITVTNDDLTHTLTPRPDKTLIIGDFHAVLEHDCGEETIELSNIIRDATIARKHLVYDQLERSGALDDLGWGKRLYLYIIDGKRGTKASSRKRIKTCLKNIPDAVLRQKIYFTDRQTFMEAGNDVSAVEWVRGDGRIQPLPCWT